MFPELLIRRIDPIKLVETRATVDRKQFDVELMTHSPENVHGIVMFTLKHETLNNEHCSRIGSSARHLNLHHNDIFHHELCQKHLSVRTLKGVKEKSLAQENSSVSSPVILRDDPLRTNFVKESGVEINQHNANVQTDFVMHQTLPSSAEL
ncbi:hypothetical protein F2P81_001613 [Scophthalmus maximus]|uniref:Uncharacterized protein n=1 Tax=Scophthalmus maximus TaxID=52904 RepID=A0A6A4TPD3_SCOMX|nr:hypothetical protein F2P81_001613 [Scophthalmus maximus]